jgi:hypothetical protein
MDEPCYHLTRSEIYTYMVLLIFNQSRIKLELAHLTSQRLDMHDASCAL